MKKIDAIVLAAGESTRFTSANKMIYQIHNTPIFMYSLKTIVEANIFSNIYLVVNNKILDFVTEMVSQNFLDKVTIVVGGSSRQESVKNALKHVSGDVVFIHDAARPLITFDDLVHLRDSTNLYSVGTLYRPVYDTVKRIQGSVVENISRDALMLISTPQFFAKDLFEEILANNEDITDEVTLFHNKQEIAFVKESRQNTKVTTKEDVDFIKFMLYQNKEFRIGHSLDYHPFVSGRKLILGGVEIPYEYGLSGHSDADCVYHAVAEALLGALGLGDLGTLFPDNDPKFKDINSEIILSDVMKLVNHQGFSVNNIDIMIYIEKPSLKAFKVKMAQNLLRITKCFVASVKATTMEKDGVIGNSEGISCEALVLLKK